jgi:phenylalanyl-tRNA synthetase beta chain
MVEALYAALHVRPRFDAGECRTAVTAEGLVREREGWGYFELDLDALFARVPDVPLYVDVITFPALKQDLAFVVDEGVPAAEFEAATREAAGPELRELRAFDVYRGNQIPAGKKSLAFRAEFQSPDRTLSDEDAAEIRDRIVRALADRFGAELRA